MIKFLIWLDRYANDKWLRGYFETISGRCFYTDTKFCRWLRKILDSVDTNHCRKAYILDRLYNPSLPNYDKLL